MISFDESNDYYSFSDSADWTFPDSDWSVSFFVRMNDITGSAWQYLFSTGAIASNGSINIFFGEASRPDPETEVWIYNSSGTQISGAGLVTTSSYEGDGEIRLWVIQRNGNDLEIKSCVPGGSVVDEASVTDNSNWTALNSATGPNIGRRTDGNSTRYFGNEAGEFYKNSFALTDAQIAALANGVSLMQQGVQPDIYLPMREATATIVDLLGDANGTRNDSPVTSAEHPPILMPQPIFCTVPPAAGPSGTILPQMIQMAA